MNGKFWILGFTITAIGYSFFRDTDYGIWIKPLPVFCCLSILLLNQNWNRKTANLLFAGLVISMLGDVALDLSFTTLGIGIFTLVMAIYGFALYKTYHYFSTISLIPVSLIFASIYVLMFSHLGDRQISGAVYQIVLIWMVWRGAALLFWKSENAYPGHYQKWLLFLGTFGIAMNGVLFGIDLYLTPIPRDLVIYSYYLGQLFLVLGIIK